MDRTEKLSWGRGTEDIAHGEIRYRCAVDGSWFTYDPHTQEWWPCPTPDWGREPRVRLVETTAFKLIAGALCLSLIALVSDINGGLAFAGMIGVSLALGYVCVALHEVDGGLSHGTLRARTGSAGIKLIYVAAVLLILGLLEAGGLKGSGGPGSG